MQQTEKKINIFLLRLMLTGSDFESLIKKKLNGLQNKNDFMNFNPKSLFDKIPKKPHK